jgi:hypothetical protein
VRPSSSDRYIPGAKAADRKTVFAKINNYIMARGGFVTSIPGTAIVTFETLPNSPIPQQLVELGYDVRPADPPEGQRILADAIVQKLTLTSSGEFEEMTEGSTKPVAEVRHHVGIARVLRYSFAL